MANTKRQRHLTDEDVLQIAREIDRLATRMYAKILVIEASDHPQAQGIADRLCTQVSLAAADLPKHAETLVQEYLTGLLLADDEA